AGVGAVEPCLHVGRKRLEQLLLRVDELLAARVGQLVLGAQHDRLHRAGVLAVAAEDAAQHVDLVRLRVALARRHAVLVGVLGGDHEDAADRASRRAELAADAALEPVVIAAQVVAAAVALRARRLLLGILGSDLRREVLAERRLQALGERADVIEHAWLVAVGLVLFVRHAYPCTSTMITPVTITLTIPSGSSTFQPSRMSMS